MKLKGRAFKFGNDVNTDEIIPARYLDTIDPGELAKHCMEDADPSFVKKVHKGDMIVAGENFGCGSSREHAPIAIKAAGVSCVIAASFARIFYRNAINIGLPIFTSAEAAAAIKDHDKLEVSVARGEVTKAGHKTVYKAEVFPDFIKDIMKDGGLMEYASRKIHPVKKKVKAEAKAKVKAKAEKAKTRPKPKKKRSAPKKRSVKTKRKK